MLIALNYSAAFKLFGPHQNWLWISLPTFDPNAAQAKLYNVIIHALPSFRKIPYIVLDVRGNGGGNDKWGAWLLSALYGKKYIDYITRPYLKMWEQFRVSKANYASLINWPNADIAGQSKQQFLAQYYKALIAGQTLYPLHAYNLQEKMPSKVQPLYHGHIYYLVDHACFSACLNGADMVHWLPSSKIIGQTTGADTPYIEVNNLILPGGQSLQYTMKIWHNRSRKAFQPYYPNWQFKGDITDTSQVMKWVGQKIKTSQK